MATQKETKSPIKNLPVRMPGQSLRERIDFVWDDKVMPYLMAAMFVIALAILEWYCAIMKVPRTPKTHTVVAIIVTLWVARKIMASKREIRDLKLGKQGEEAVGQFLDEKLRPLGCQVLHDIPADGFNVDHVAVGPTGVFSVETKTHSKPVKGETIVNYDGEKVTVNGFIPDRDPIVQATSTARWLSDLLAQTTGRRFSVQPIVVYPGWYVKMPQESPVWVLNEGGVPTFIKNARGRLAPEDVALITFHLKRYVIAKATEKK